MCFVVGNSVQVLKAAAFKRFSVCPCWSPILLRLQNSIAGVFQCVFNKISEHIFYRTTMNWYFGTKQWRCKYWSSIVLFERGIASEKTRVQIFKFLLQVFNFLILNFFVFNFCFLFKECLWPRKSNKNIAFVAKERKYFFLEKPSVCKNVS